jgi:hypothetical protein
MNEADTVADLLRIGSSARRACAVCRVGGPPNRRTSERED